MTSNAGKRKKRSDWWDLLDVLGQIGVVGDAEGLGIVLGVILLIVLVAGTCIGVPQYLRSRKRRLRAEQGLCLECGYDLRASPERCPECGSPAPRGRRGVIRITYGDMRREPNVAAAR